jgi:hypothetical protein
VVLGLEKDSFGIQSGGTLFFAERTGLELVVDDSDHIALHQFFSPNRGEGTNNSDFVVLNGVPNSASHQLWEVVYTRSLRPSIRTMKEAIDSVEAGGAPLGPAEPAVLSAPSVAGGLFSFSVQGTPGHSGVVEFSSDGVTWSELQKLEFGEESIVVSDSESAEQSHRFYRVSTLE